MTDETTRVGVLAASPSELSTMRQAGLILEKFGVGHEIRIMSSSRNPDLVDEYARTAFDRGLKVIICSTGLSGHLAAAVAARTVLPVIGVPIATAPQMVGNEALAITAQMPTGSPSPRSASSPRSTRRCWRPRSSGCPTPRCRRRSGGSRTTSRRASSCDPAVQPAGDGRGLVGRDGG